MSTVLKDEIDFKIIFSRHSLSGIRGMSTKISIEKFIRRKRRSRHSLSGIRGMSTDLYKVAQEISGGHVAIPCRELGGCQLNKHSLYLYSPRKTVAIPCRELGGCQRFKRLSKDYDTGVRRHSLSGIRGMSTILSKN